MDKKVLTNEEKEEMIREINRRINGLSEHRIMWSRAGGMGGKMAMQASQEIHELKMQRDDLINGTHEFEIYKLEKEIKRLKLLRDDAILLQKRKLNKEIKKKEEELKIYTKK